MTEEELEKVPFYMVSHAVFATENTATYSSRDGRLGFCVHTKVKNDFGGMREYGRTYTHYRIGTKIYKSKAKFIEALKDLKL